jgi:glycine cleavage system H protein
MARTSLSDGHKLDDAARVLKALSDRNRLRIFNLLMQSDSCNCELGERLSLSRTLLSHHLSVLRDAGLLRSRPDAVDSRWIYYSVDRKAATSWRDWLYELLDPARIQERVILCGPEGQPRGECTAPADQEQRSCIPTAANERQAEERTHTMAEYLSATIDKFTFRVATDRRYSQEHLWLKPENGLVRVGVTDYLQQRSGDVAFAEVVAAGTRLAGGDELGTIETIKVTLALPCPIAGIVKEVNPALADAPEVVNQDPYGAGWLALLEAGDWQADQARLLDAQAYFKSMQTEAEEETRRI